MSPSVEFRSFNEPLSRSFLSAIQRVGLLRCKVYWRYPFQDFVVSFDSGGFFILLPHVCHYPKGLVSCLLNLLGSEVHPLIGREVNRCNKLLLLLK